MPPAELLAPLATLGFPGVIIGLLIWALVRKDKQVETLQESRVVDQKDRAADNLRAATVIEQLNAAARTREDASESRWRIMEQIGDGVKATAKALEVLTTEHGRNARVIDSNQMRLERIESLLDRR
jgi:hypothetical protein